MSRGGGGARTRVKTSRGRTASSNRWLARQLNDPYVRKAKAEGYRSRAAYKIARAGQRFNLLKSAKAVVDSACPRGLEPGRGRARRALGSRDRMLEHRRSRGFEILQMTSWTTVPRRAAQCACAEPDLVLSDMAANTVGHPQPTICAPWAGRGGPDVRHRSDPPRRCVRKQKFSRAAPPTASSPN